MPYLILGLDIENKPTRYSSVEHPLTKNEEKIFGGSLEEGMLISEMTGFAVWTRSDIPELNDQHAYSKGMHDFSKENAWLRKVMRDMQIKAQKFNKTSDPIDYYLVAHNAMFDISQFADLRSNINSKTDKFRKAIENGSYLFTNSGKLYGGTYKVLNSSNVLESRGAFWKIRDTNNVFSGKLEEQAKEILGDKKEKYDIYDEKYVTKDAELAARLFEYQLTEYFDAMTASSLSLRKFKEFYADNSSKTKEDIGDILFYNTTTDDDVISYLDSVARDAYYGGLTGSPANLYAPMTSAITYTNPKSVIVQFDFISMYSSVATSENAKYPKPTRPDVYYAGDDLEELAEIFDFHKDSFRTIHFDNLKFSFGKETHSNVLSSSRYANTKVFWDGELDSKSFVEADAKYFIENVEYAEWDNAVLYTHECDKDTQRIITKYFNMLGNEKLVSKGAKKEMIKKLQNGLTGKFGQNIIENEHFSFYEGVERKMENPYKVQRYNVNYVSNLTALARVAMMEFSNKMGIDKVIQLDTDSGKVLIESQEDLDKLYGILKGYDEKQTPSNRFHGLKLEQVYDTYKLVNRKMHGGMKKELGEDGHEITYKTTFDEMMDSAVVGVHFAHAGMSEEAFEETGETDAEKFDNIDFGLEFKGLTKVKTPTGLTLIEVNKRIIAPNIDMNGEEVLQGDIIVDSDNGVSDLELSM